MRRVSRRGLLRTAAAAAVVGLSARVGAGQPVSITFILVNDIYKMNADKGRGGTGKLAAVVRAERASKDNVLFVHAGDTLSPSLMSGFDQGAHMIALFNAIQPDVFVPGNHEFDFGKAVYLKRVGEAKFPVLAANLRQADGSPLPGHRDTLMIEKAGLKIGFVGTTLETTPQISSPGDLQFAGALQTVVKQAAALRQAGADLVVAVVHADKLTGQQIMESGSVDLILSGHNHDLHLDYDGKSLLAESGEDGQFITAIDLSLTVKSEGNRRSVGWTPIPGFPRWHAAWCPSSIRTATWLSA